MERTENSCFYPILINLQRFPCLIIGGGKVACRKVSSLLEFNADVTVLSPKISKPIQELSKELKIKIIKKAYSIEFIKNYKIVFSTVDNPEINKMIRRDCTAEGIILNAADNPSLCDFILPANIKRGNLIISVSSQAKAPFYAKEIKEKISRIIPSVYSQIIDLAGEYRKQVLNGEKITSHVKAKLFKRFIKVDWEKILSGNGKVNSKEVTKIIKQNLI